MTVSASVASAFTLSLIAAVSDVKHATRSGSCLRRSGRRQLSAGFGSAGAISAEQLESVLTIFNPALDYLAFAREGAEHRVLVEPAPKYP